MTIPEITLNNGYKIPQIGLGVYKIGDQSEMDDAVSGALEAGYRHFDTAAFYGNEAMLAKSLKDNGVKREDVFITSKLWNANHGYEETLAAFEQTLKNLETDYLDMYLIHWPSPDYIPSYQAMEKLYLEGKIRAIGVSNFGPDHLENLIKHTSIRPVVDQVETNLYFQQKLFHGFLEQENIIQEAWSPFAHGNSNIWTEPVIMKIAQAHHKTAGQVMLRWQIQRNTIVIPKSIHKDRLAENIDIFDFELSDSEMASIALLDHDQRTSHSPYDLPWLLSTTQQNY